MPVLKVEQPCCKKIIDFIEMAADENDKKVPMLGMIGKRAGEVYHQIKFCPFHGKPIIK